MSNFYFSKFEEMTGTREIIGAVSGPDAVVKIVNGAGKSGSGLCSLITVVDANRALNMRIHTSLPEGFEGEKETVAVKASQFTGVLDALLPYKADVGNGTNAEGRYFLEVKGKARVEVNTLAETPAEVKVADPIFAFSLDSPENSKLLKRGLSCSADSATAMQGSQNGVLVIDTTTGKMVSFSMDGNMFSRAEITGKLPKAPEGDGERAEKARAVMAAQKEALKAFLEKNGQQEDRLTIAIPHDEIARLRALTQGAKTIQWQIDATHVSVCVNSAVIYTFTQGATIPADVDALMGKLSQIPGEKVQVDNDALTRGVELHNKIISLNKKSGRSPVKIEVGTQITCHSGADGATVSAVPIGGKTGECEFYVTGQLFRTALGLMPKGNLVLDIKPQIVLFMAGTEENVDKTAAVGLMQVNPSVLQKEEESEEEEVSED